MRSILKCLAAFVAIFLAATSVWAGEVNIVRQLNGTDSDAAGEVVASNPVDGVVTLTVTPASGNYITAEYITVERTIIGNLAQARFNAPDIDGNAIEVTPLEVTDPAGTTTYSFEMPADEYDVEVVVDFQSRISIVGATVTLSEAWYTYDGEAKEPEVSSVVIGDFIFESTDYSVAYENNINAGTAVVTITGQGICIGEVSAEFIIDKAPINDDLMMVRIDDWTYGEDPKDPYLEGTPDGVEVVYDFFTMDEEYGEFVGVDGVPVNAGSYVIRALIAESDNYLEGELYNEFTIEQADLALVTIEPIDDQNYTGEAVEPAIVVMFNGSVVSEDEYSVHYENNVGPGTATVKLSSKNVNFHEPDVQPSQTFEIVGKEINMNGHTWITYVPARDMTVPAGLKAYVVTDVNGRNVVVEEIDRLPQAKAVLIEEVEPQDQYITAPWKGEWKTFNSLLQFSEISVNVSDLTAENDIYVLYNGEFVKTTSGMIPQFRGYLPIAKNQGAEARLSIFVDDSCVTGIAEMNNGNEEMNNAIYDLNGRRLDNSLKKGLYIVNGKKVVIK